MSFALLKKTTRLPILAFVVLATLGTSTPSAAQEIEYICGQPPVNGYGSVSLVNYYDWIYFDVGHNYDFSSELWLNSTGGTTDYIELHAPSIDYNLGYFRVTRSNPNSYALGMQVVATNVQYIPYPSCSSGYWMADSIDVYRIEQSPSNPYSVSLVTHLSNVQINGYMTCVSNYWTPATQSVYYGTSGSCMTVSWRPAPYTEY